MTYIGQALCPTRNCGVWVQIPPSKTPRTKVDLLCHSCGETFLAHLCGDIDINDYEETQMATSKKAAQAAIKAKAAPVKKAAAKISTKPGIRKDFKYTALFDKNPKRDGSKAFNIFAALKSAGKKSTADAVMKKLTAKHPKAGYVMYDVTDGLYMGIKPGHIQRDAA